MIINLPLGNVLLYISVAIIVAAVVVVVSVAVSAYECRKKADFNLLFFPVSFSLGMGSTWGSWRSEAEWLADWLLLLQCMFSYPTVVCCECFNCCCFDSVLVICCWCKNYINFSFCIVLVVCPHP